MTPPQTQPTISGVFESITGQSTITEDQRTDVSIRFDEHGAEQTVTDYVDTTAPAHGFDDVIGKSDIN